MSEDDMDRLDDWQTIINVAIAKAKEGDPQAREWLGRYVLKDARLRALAGLPVGSGKTILEDLMEAGGGASESL